MTEWYDGVYRLEFCINACLLQFISKPDSLLLEDKGG